MTYKTQKNNPYFSEKNTGFVLKKMALFSHHRSANMP